MGIHTSNNCGCSGSGGGSTPGQPGNEFAQNNILKKINGGLITILGGARPVIENLLAAKLNQQEFTVTEIDTPVLVYSYVQFPDSPLRSYIHYFLPGKGFYGLNATQVTGSMLTIAAITNLTIADAQDSPFTITINLGNLPDGDYLTAVNSAERDFVDSAKTYFITYDKDGKTFLLRFAGAYGSYGGSYPDDFIMEDFLPASDSDVEPSITKTSQVINDGADGVDPYATVSEVNGLVLTVDQATAKMFLKSKTGLLLASVNLGFLNNEGTTFFFNDATQNLELQNDDGEVLSEVPVSAFVSNLIQSVEFNAAAPYTLEFKDSTGNVVDTVNVTINNVQGLQAALNNKVNKDGSNAVPFSNWPINAASANDALKFGDAYGDFLNDGTVTATNEGITHAVGYNAPENKVRRYTKSNFKTWLAIAMTDVSGLTAAFANVTSVLSGKADLDKTLAVKSNIGFGANLNDYTSTGIYSQLSDAQAMSGTNYPIGYAGKLEVVNADYVYQTYHGYGNQNKLFFRGLYGGIWSPWKEVADNTNVLHKIGDETLQGSLAITQGIKSPQFIIPNRTVNNYSRGYMFSNDVNIYGDLGLLKEAEPGSNVYSPVFYVSGGNNFGFGTIDPQAKVDIAGTARAFNYTVNDGQITLVTSEGEVQWAISIDTDKSLTIANQYLTSTPAIKIYKGGAVELPLGKLAVGVAPTAPNDVVRLADLPPILDNALRSTDFDVDVSFKYVGSWFSGLEGRYPDALPGFRVFGIDNDGNTNVEAIKLASNYWVWKDLTGEAGVRPS